jgi:CheY-like chemotaxis protein
MTTSIKNRKYPKKDICDVCLLKYNLYYTTLAPKLKIYILPSALFATLLVMSRKYKIAVIEDNLPICSMYEMKLSSAGYEVKTAQNGEEGLKLTEVFLPELILLDLKMPIMSGDIMLEKLRKTDWGAKIRVIILTNISRDEAPHNLRLLSIDRYIVKAHHTPAQVVDIVKEVLGLN